MAGGRTWYQAVSLVTRLVAEASDATGNVPRTRVIPGSDRTDSGDIQDHQFPGSLCVLQIRIEENHMRAGWMWVNREEYDYNE